MTQREFTVRLRHNHISLTYIKRLPRRIILFSKSEEPYVRFIGCYLTINHYQ
ncbi:IS1 family transposase [Serratia fonticola]|uniref:IS1 family transposase n=1 Tax=Serratia fonticola TaxID=47917 RepID=UPI003BB656F4